jgi:hypothetical protein
MINDNLIYGEKAGGYYVRPITWAGTWDKHGKLVYGNTLYECNSEKECLEYITGRKKVMNKKEIVDKLNSLKIADYSVSGGELEYIMIEDTAENRQVLSDLGVSQEIIKEMGNEPWKELDITNFVFQNLQIEIWHPVTGFQYKTQEEIYLDVLNSIKAGNENIIADAKEKQLFKEAITKAIEAYEKINIPKKPILKQKRIISDLYICPSCNIEFENLIDRNPKHCHECAQLFDWGQQNE